MQIYNSTIPGGSGCCGCEGVGALLLVGGAAIEGMYRLVTLRLFCVPGSCVGNGIIILNDRSSSAPSTITSS